MKLFLQEDSFIMGYTNAVDYLRQRLTNYGYNFAHITDTDAFFMERGETDISRKVWVSYLDKEISQENIRRALEFSGHVLFIVDEKLIPDAIDDRKSTPYWLRVLHGLYMGRIYVWNGRYLFALHFDWDTGDVSESGIIQPEGLLLVETGTWLKGWSGIYRLARFYDRAWWQADADSANEQYTQYKQQRERQEKSNNKQAPPKRDESDYYYSEQSSGRQSHEGFYTGQGRTDGKQEPPKQKTAPRDWLKEFLNCGTLAAAKKHYRKLALEFHPDRSGADTTADMQLINAAWDKAQRMMA